MAARSAIKLVTSMYKILIITESPSKARALSRVIPNNIGDFKVVSCLGRIYELDPIHPDEFFFKNKPISWTPLKEDNLRFLKDCISNSQKVLIATDPDIEGEVIAWQLQQLVDYIKPNEAISGRLYINEISKPEFEKSLKSIKEIDAKKARAGINRRIFDNFSRFAFSEESIKKRPFLKGGHGRVTTPLLGSINDKPLKKAIVKYQRKGMPLPAIIHVSANQDVDSIIRQLDRLPAPVFKKIQEQETLFENKGLDYNTLMKYISRITKKDPEDSYKALQSLYEKGEISYFRTDSQALSKQQKTHLKQSLKSEGASEFREPKNKSQKRAQDGHFAITPLKNTSSDWQNIKGKGIEDQILAIIWRYWVINTQKRKIKTKSATLEPNAFENKIWLKLEKDFNIKFEASKLTNSSDHYFKYDDEFLPLGLCVESEKKESLQVIYLSQRESLIERMIEEDLARPSTLVHHSKKFAKNFLSDFTLNKKGISAINENRRENHPLLSPEISREIESHLHSYDSDNSTSQVKKAIKKSHFRSKSRYQFETKEQKNLEHIINWPKI